MTDAEKEARKMQKDQDEIERLQVALSEQALDYWYGLEGVILKQVTQERGFPLDDPILQDAPEHRDTLQMILNSASKILLYQKEIDDLEPYLQREIEKANSVPYTIEHFRDVGYSFDDAGKICFSLPDDLQRMLDKARTAEAAAEAANGEANEIKAERPSVIFWPLDKFNSIIWNLTEQQTSGTVTINLARTGSKQSIPAYYYVNFDSLPGVEISKQLTAYDKLVYCAAASVFLAGNESASVTQVCYAMGYGNTPGRKTLKKVNNSLTKLRQAVIIIDNEAEAAVYNYEHIRYDGSLLPMERVSKIINGKAVDSAIHFFREPPMIELARKRKQYTTIPILLLQAPAHKTDDALTIHSYLIERIAREKAKKSNKAKCVKMLYSTIFEKTGIPNKPTTEKDKKRKSRAPGKINDFLDYVMGLGFITLYTVQKNASVTVYWRPMSDRTKAAILKRNEQEETKRLSGTKAK